MEDLSQSGRSRNLVHERHDALSQEVTTLAQTHLARPSQYHPDLASPSRREAMKQKHGSRHDEL